MSKQAHTPGPWRYDRDNLNIYANGMLAQTFGHTHNGEREANAQLIAACPELLEQLQILIEVVAEAATGIEESHPIIALYLRKQIEFAQAAIVKAEGRE